MTPLYRALALAEVHDVAVVVADHLELDVLRVLQILFDVHVAVPERRLGLTLRRPQRSAQLVRGPHDAHAAAAAAGHGLDDHRIADVPGRG